MRLRYIIYLFFTLNLTCLYAQEINHVGTWEAMDNTQQQPMQMVLDDEGFISFIVNKQHLGGKYFYSDGKPLCMTYRTNYTDTTGTISIILKDPKTKHIIKRDTGTLTFIDSNHMQLCFKKPIDEERSEFIEECVSFLKIK